MANAIEINNLTKYYGKSKGIENVTFNVEEERYSGLSVQTVPVSQQLFARYWL